MVIRDRNGSRRQVPRWPRTGRGWAQIVSAAAGLATGLFYFALILRGQRAEGVPFFVLTNAFLLLARAAAFWPTPADTDTGRRVWAVLAGIAFVVGLIGVGSGLAALTELLPGIATSVSVGVVSVAAVAWLVSLARPERTA